MVILRTFVLFARPILPVIALLTLLLPGVLSYLLALGTTVTFTSGECDPSTSGISLHGMISGSPNGEWDDVAVEIKYSKGWESYVQQVTLEWKDTGASGGAEETVFGHDAKDFDQTCCEIYRGAYAAQWERFAELCAGGETPRDSEVRLDGYKRTFECLEQAAAVLGVREKAAL